MLAKFSIFVKLDKCGLIQAHWRTLCEEYLLQFEIRSEKIIMAKASGHISKHVNVINVFHYVNSILYTVPRILLKVSNVFLRENLPLFTVTSIHSIQKKKKTETPKQSGRQQKIQGSNRSKDREIELITKKFEGKEKVFNTKEID